MGVAGTASIAMPAGQAHGEARPAADALQKVQTGLDVLMFQYPLAHTHAAEPSAVRGLDSSNAPHAMQLGTLEVGSFQKPEAHVQAAPQANESLHWVPSL